MLTLRLQSANGQFGIAEMLIEYESESIDFTVLHGTTQFDFSIEKHEWDQFKMFIESAIKIEELTHINRSVTN